MSDNKSNSGLTPNTFQIIHIAVDFIAICLVMYYCSSKISAVREENDKLRKDIEDMKVAVGKQNAIISNILQHVQSIPKPSSPKKNSHHKHSHKTKPPKKPTKKVKIVEPEDEESFDDSELDKELANQESLGSLSDDQEEDDEIVIEDEEVEVDV